MEQVNGYRGVCVCAVSMPSFAAREIVVEAVVAAVCRVAR